MLFQNLVVVSLRTEGKKATSGHEVKDQIGRKLSRYLGDEHSMGVKNAQDPQSGTTWPVSPPAGGRGAAEGAAGGRRGQEEGGGLRFPEL